MTATDVTMSEEAPGATQALTETELQTAIEAANIPTLLMTVYQFTGDERWLRAPYAPTRGKGLGDHDSGGLPPAIQAEIRAVALDVVLRLQRGEQPAIEVPDAKTAVRMIAVSMGEEVDDAYGPLVSSEIRRRIAPTSHVQPNRAQVIDGFSVVVIGAGVSGIVAAQQLEELGVNYTIIEKQPRAGGNWWQNTYPGAGVDTPSHLYSFSFAQNDWQHHFELRSGLQEYFERVIDDVGATPRVRYQTEVVSVEFVEATSTWRVRVRDSAGREEILEPNVVISAVGVLNRPRLPNVDGLDSFVGPSFHSAAWPEGLDVTGKRVAVIGTGASSMQIVPAIADQVAHLTVFQRSPQWVAPFEKFRQPIPPELRALLRACPIYFAWYWVRLFWQFGDRVIEALRIDPSWKHSDRSVNSRNDGHRIFFTEYMKESLSARPDLLPKTLPDYPPFGKRILLDNGWFDALQKDHVELVAEAVASVQPNGITSESGTTYPADVLVWATGFESTRFLASFDVIGADGTTLREVWDDDNPSAYLGLAVPRFPNFFMLGGPNSFPGSGSFMFFMEMQMRYIRQLLSPLIAGTHQRVEATAEAADAYTHQVDSLHEQMIWTHPGMTTFYRNSRGRVVFVMPFLNVEYWNMTKEPDWGHYHLV